MKYLPERSEDNPLLIMYDGHMPHISIKLINGAKTHNLILFILPAHTVRVNLYQCETQVPAWDLWKEHYKI